MDMFSEQNAETEGASGTTYIDPAALTSSGKDTVATHMTFDLMLLDHACSLP